MKLSEAKKLYLDAKRAYYSGGSPIMSDARFDKLEDWLQAKCPEWEELRNTGVKVGKKVEVPLPFFMPSLSKVYPEDADRWFDSNVSDSYVYMSKLDGCSVYLEYINGKPSRLLTRGDGKFGKDISYFLPYLSIPKQISHRDRIGFRCEAILQKEVFDEKWSKLFDASRNMVSGILNRQTAHKALSDIHFVVLGVFDRPLIAGLRLAFNLGFETVFHRVDAPRMQAKYLDVVRRGKFEADGVVISRSDFVYHYDSAEKPRRNIIAYKENTEIKETTVVDVLFQISSAGRIIPKIKVAPVELSGATVEFCTSHNAKWMIDHGIGKGARILIARSGEVIPKIIDVLERGTIVYPNCSFEMDGCHFKATKLSREQSVRTIEKFVTVLGIDDVKRQTIDAMYDMGVNSIPKLFKALSNPKFEGALMRTFGPKKGSNIHSHLSELRTKSFSLVDLMVASSVFPSGIGAKRLTSLQKLGFDLMQLSEWEPSKIKYSIISPGIGEAVASMIADGLVDFREFFGKIRSYIKEPVADCPTPSSHSDGPLNGVCVTFTGYRDDAQRKLIESLGGEIVDFSKKTTVLLYREGGRRSSKIEKAGDRAMTFDAFKKKFKL